MTPRTNLTIDLPRLTRLCVDHQVSRLWLFGSALRADFRPDSDVDILVEFDATAKVGLIALSRLQRELSDLVGRRVDLVPLIGLKPAVRDEISATRELLYAS